MLKTKKIPLIFLTILIVILINPGIGFSLPFDSSGWVDPNYSNSWDPSSATGTARYYFYWDSPSVKVTELDLQFEGDIFNLSQLDLTDFNIIAPPGWTTQMYNETDQLRWSISYGEGIDFTQDPIIIEVNYTLLSASRYYYGSNNYANENNTWAWNEAQGANTPWAQKYMLYGSSINSDGSYSSGGSTAPVPEPGTLLLLGSGLIGLFAVRKKIKK